MVKNRTRHVHNKLNVKNRPRSGMQNNQFLIYGANGYSGQLISKLATELDLNPVVAGRNKQAIQQLSGNLHVPYRIIDLDDEMNLQKNLADVALVLHAAGP